MMFILQVDEPATSWSPPSARASEVILSTKASHYELQVEIGNDVKPTAQRLFCGRLFLYCHLQHKLDFNRVC